MSGYERAAKNHAEIESSPVKVLCAVTQLSLDCLSVLRPTVFSGSIFTDRFFAVRHHHHLRRTDEHALCITLLPVIATNGAVGMPGSMTEQRKSEDETDERRGDRNEKEDQHDRSPS